MEWASLLKLRRSIRSFQDRPVPMNLIQDLLEESRLAPSAYNQQPWHFILLQDQGLIRRISDDCKTNALAHLAENPGSPLCMDVDDLRDPQHQIFHQAPLVVLEAGPDSWPFLDVDSALWASYFMFAAVTRNLGACWIGLGKWLRNPDLLKEIGLPQGFRISVPLAVGYPIAIPEPKPRAQPRILAVK
jgi:nitroreductase